MTRRRHGRQGRIRKQKKQQKNQQIIKNEQRLQQSIKDDRAPKIISRRLSIYIPLLKSRLLKLRKMLLSLQHFNSELNNKLLQITSIIIIKKFLKKIFLLKILYYNCKKLYIKNKKILKKFDKFHTRYLLGLHYYDIHFNQDNKPYCWFCSISIVISTIICNQLYNNNKKFYKKIWNNINTQLYSMSIREKLTNGFSLMHLNETRTQNITIGINKKMNGQNYKNFNFEISLEYCGSNLEYLLYLLDYSRYFGFCIEIESNKIYTYNCLRLIFPNSNKGHSLCCIGIINNSIALCKNTHGTNNSLVCVYIKDIKFITSIKFISHD